MVPMTLVIARFGSNLVPVDCACPNQPCTTNVCQTSLNLPLRHPAASNKSPFAQNLLAWTACRGHIPLLISDADLSSILQKFPICPHKHGIITGIYLANVDGRVDTQMIYLAPLSLVCRSSVLLDLERKNQSTLTCEFALEQKRNTWDSLPFS